MLKFILLAGIFIMSLSSCSYQKMNLSEQQFTIDEIEINGNKRTSFLIERKIKRYSKKGSSNKLVILINLSEKKDINEKNIKNKVTKYKLTLTAETNIRNLKNSEIIKRSYSSNTIYNVESKYTDTLNNEKEARSRLIDLIGNQLLDELKINYN
tara:strand:+ start:1478 stop:1939 length:462 start_codon:yes stop_codon:yes gene_type:complete